VKILLQKEWQEILNEGYETSLW